MRRLSGALLAGCLAIACIVGISHPASAQSQFNCTMLSGTPFLCLKNASNSPIVAVQAVAPGYGWFNPSAWISIPGGGIMPGGAAVVRFPTYRNGDVQNIVVRTADGQPHYIWSVNVRSNTSLTIRW
jgi:hypothetical protein